MIDNQLCVFETERVLSMTRGGVDRTTSDWVLLSSMIFELVKGPHFIRLEIEYIKSGVFRVKLKLRPFLQRKKNCNMSQTSTMCLH